MAIGNLVDGGARRGLFVTRRNRRVRLLTPFQFSEPQAPGRPLETRTCWKGIRYMADGHTPDSELVWEETGAFQSRNGVPYQPDDLVTLISLDPDEPLELAQIAAGEDLATENARLRAENEALKLEVGGLREWKRARKAAQQTAVNA
jgi:hypothetical protein